MQEFTVGDTFVEYYLNKFDRCSGQMTAFKKFSIFSEIIKYGDDANVGVAFSPNDSLLYVTTAYSVWQIPIYDTNTANYLKLSGPDTLLDYFPHFNNIALAPNGKIYIGNYHGISKSMDFIDQPNIRGKGCGFKGRGKGAISNAYTGLEVPPNMPSYSLGALVGSPCDTLNKPKPPLPVNWLVYPNPASEQINITVPIDATQLQYQIINMLGMQVQNNSLPINTNHQAIINDISALANGVYIIKIIANGSMYNTKFVKTNL